MEKTLDLSGLIKGLLSVMGIAFAIGQGSHLQTWAREQAAESLAWKRGLPHFFAAARIHRNQKYRRYTGAEPVNGGGR